jgi:ABC-type sugar transport system ATPase subunit
MQNATKPMPTSRPNATRVDASALLAALHDARALYVELLALVRTRREAVRVADLARFTKLADSESRILARLSELDRVRVAEARALATRMALPPDATLADIAARLPEPTRAQIDLARSELKDALETVRRESSVLRQAAERLSAHMAGILQSVHSALTHANVYSRGGRIAVGANVMSSLDIRS